MTQLTLRPLGGQAKGTIGQGATPEKAALDLLESGDFTRKAVQWLIGVCGDERCDIHGSRLLLPAGFGGFAGLVMTDALTARKWYTPGMTFVQHVIAAREAVNRDFPEAKAAVHTDTTALAAAEAAKKAGRADVVVECGCAALAKSGAVLELLIAEPDHIPAEYRDAVVRNAQGLLESGYVQTGTASIVDTLGSMGLAVEILDGDHDGVALIWNKRKGTVIDRPKLYEACKKAGVPVLSAFEYDEWAMHEAAKKLAPNDAAFFAAGGDALMLTTIRAIASPDLTVITYV